MSEWDIVLRTVVAALLGGLVGFDREERDKPAGIRTHAMVAAGAALFVGVSLLVSVDLEIGGTQSARIDASRVTAGVVTGIGFLGAGSIIRRDGSVSGLTTAAGIWTVAAVGVAIAYGYWWVGVGGTAIVLLLQVSDYFAHRAGLGVRSDAKSSDT